MNKVGIPFDYFHFESLLRGYIEVYHPQLADDKLFVADRVDEAYSLYRQLTEEGITRYAAYELAVSVLFDE